MNPPNAASTDGYSQSSAEGSVGRSGDSDDLLTDGLVTRPSADFAAKRQEFKKYVEDVEAGLSPDERATLDTFRAHYASRKGWRPIGRSLLRRRATTRTK